ncbi:DUF6573 family protein [Cupriavidus metallidurans]|uniref:DUF6573 family protein n=1 Tax=Cupriavidus metallidurans TaxID=119219 RepID=UPI001CCC6177|nr:DUF6573 family protein [Cupriavidus metallidurans]UBM12811.1 hypothetical protein LAI70_28060 [Cupriavidus metallidurans]
MSHPISTPTICAHQLAACALVDVTETARVAGFTLPVLMTVDAWANCVRWTDEDAERTKTLQDQAERLWDVLWTLRVAIGNGPTLIQKLDPSRLIWTLMRMPTDGPRKPTRVKLKAMVGLGDIDTPALTIKLTTED